MFTGIILAALGAKQAPALDLSAPYRAESTVRLALTPRLDGRIEPEEWDAFGPGGSTFFQWEPGILYFAGSLKTGEDLMVSLDQGGDGWLQGRDNLEFRFTMASGEPRFQVRSLDAADAGGAKWTDGGVLRESVKIAAQPSAGGWQIEASYIPRLGANPDAGARFGLRMDAVASGLDGGEAFRPRGMAAVILQYDSSRGLPAGMAWRPAIAQRSIAREDRLRMKFELEREEGTFQPARIEMRGEGFAKDMLAVVSQPFPGFDRGKKAGVEFDSLIAPGATVGWRVVRGIVRDAQGAEFIVRSSIRIADLVDFEYGFPTGARAGADAQLIRGNVTLRSQFSGRVEGIFSFDVPSEWTITRGRTQRFLIYHTRGTARVPIEFIIPRGTKGTFPIRFTAVVGSETISRTIYFLVE